MQTYTDPDFKFGQVPHLEGPNAVKDVETHVGHFSRMTGAIPVGDSGSHHVGISNCFHLNAKEVREGCRGVIPCFSSLFECVKI